ncbi:hypothetical protein LPB136_04830 [Tenacibaculum todarodis]|uniref:DUF3185 domain-containing protein n=1 Tax=Tenacibaculum todarodis TaxID=1850252 RepID=A0A1L3JHW1_9FLAO|nr:hypothetical protein [Tenacibaculum todarodis]APG64725.1 hypothetical protein LPB136_04830 [Tenacibaculum todarodis]
MNKTIKTILIVVGILLVAYGAYEIIVPEASLDIGIAEFEAQDNNSAYITLGAGIVTLLIGLFVNKK